MGRAQRKARAARAAASQLGGDLQAEGPRLTRREVVVAIRRGTRSRAIGRFLAKTRSIVPRNRGADRQAREPKRERCRDETKTPAERGRGLRTVILGTYQLATALLLAEKNYAG